MQPSAAARARVPPGRSPDLRFNSLDLPSHFLKKQWFNAIEASTLTVAGPCWIFTSFPNYCPAAFEISFPPSLVVCADGVKKPVDKKRTLLMNW